MIAANRQLVGELRLTAYPPDGPFERWELTVEATGEVLASGLMPASEEVIRSVAAAYRIGLRHGAASA
jgi:hypothetical protein